MTDDDRLNSLETKIAFQEDLLQALNDTVIALQTRFAELEQRHRELRERVGALHDAPASSTPGDERPPHY